MNVKNVNTKRMQGESSYQKISGARGEKAYAAGETPLIGGESGVVQHRHRLGRRPGGPAAQPGHQGGALPREEGKVLATQVGQIGRAHV